MFPGSNPAAKAAVVLGREAASFMESDGGLMPTCSSLATAYSAYAPIVRYLPSLRARSTHTSSPTFSLVQPLPTAATTPATYLGPADSKIKWGLHIFHHEPGKYGRCYILKDIGPQIATA